jgi:Asp-tRNA(Asn)/Glu-tRNA(Gln) amidotransferase C subunit
MMTDKLRAAAKIKMTLEELRNMISMSNTITFAKRMQRAEPEEIERELLACINEWLRGDDELTRLKREKNS